MFIDRDSDTAPIPIQPHPVQNAKQSHSLRDKVFALMRTKVEPRAATNHQPTKDYSKDLSELLDALAIAKSADDHVEVEAAIQFASTRANHLGIDLAVARQQNGSIKWPNSLIEEKVQLGYVGDRDFPSYVDLFVTYAAQHSIRTVQSPKTATIYCYGYAEDIATTIDLYDATIRSVIDQIEREIGDGKHKALEIPAQTYRRSALSGFIERLRERLRDELRAYVSESSERAFAYSERDTATALFMRERTKGIGLASSPKRTRNINTTAFMSGTRMAETLSVDGDGHA